MNHDDALESRLNSRLEELADAPLRRGHDQELSTLLHQHARRSSRRRVALRAVGVTAAAALVGGSLWALGTGSQGPTPVATDPTPVATSPIATASSTGQDTPVASGTLAFGHSTRMAQNDATLNRWLSAADAVAVVTVADEPAAPVGAPTPGNSLRLRDLKISVDEVLWSQPKAPDLPTSFSLTTLGWTWEGGVWKRMALPSSSRLEVGHQYVVALVRPVPDCVAPGPKTWGLLADEAALPADGGAIGTGEYEGSVGGSPPTATEHLLLNEWWGRNTSTLKPALAAVPAEVYGTGAETFGLSTEADC